ncbi:MAG TPA: hypothetical protein ENN95_02740, partial [Deltaproteobacteria bacterium]|nr:hypothetical protein [Deltaproteobacteria bacterium]
MKAKQNKLLISLLLVLFAAGCGIKSNPVPLVSMVDYRQMISDVKASAADNSVVLTWQLNDKRSVIKNIYVERSEVGGQGNECAGCPLNYERIGQKEIIPSLLKSAQIKKQSFTDTNVEEGKTYNYRLMLCDDAGVCQEKSGAQIN